VLKRSLAALPFSHPYTDRFDAITPYGYAGPLLTDPAMAETMWQAWSETARAAGIIAEFIRFHPLLGNHEPFAALFDVRQAGRTVWMNLSGDPEAGLSRSARRNTRLAERAGLRIERADDYLPHFFAMYNETMYRKAADGYYFFERGYFERLRNGLGPDFWLMRAHQAERDAAYALCLRCRGHLHYHLSCSAENLARYKAVDLLLLETARAGRAAGLRAFHLGGGYRGEDSLFEFKSRFAAERAGFFVGRAVHDADAVVRLTTLAFAAGEFPADPNFFPPYRRQR
jgi:hypothetical protein